MAFLVSFGSVCNTCSKLLKLLREMDKDSGLELKVFFSAKITTVIGYPTANRKMIYIPGC